MPDYKVMYEELLRGVAKASNVLHEAQLNAEQKYFASLGKETSKEDDSKSSDLHQQ